MRYTTKQKFFRQNCQKCAAYLLRNNSVSVAGENLQSDTATNIFQQFLQFFWIVSNLVAIHLFNNVTYMQKTLSIYHSAMKNPCYYKIVVLNSKRNTLKEVYDT